MGVVNDYINQSLRTFRADPKIVGDCPEFAESSEQIGTVPILFGPIVAERGLASNGGNWGGRRSIEGRGVERSAGAVGSSNRAA